MFRVGMVFRVMVRFLLSIQWRDTGGGIRVESFLDISTGLYDGQRLESNMNER